MAAVTVPARLGFAPVLSPLRTGEQQRVLKPPFSTKIERVCARWYVPSFSREECRCSCVLIPPVNCTFSEEPAHLLRDVAVSGGPGELRAFPPTQDTARCCWTVPCRGGEGAWRSHCSAASCPLPLASLIHLSKHNTTDTQQMSPVLPGRFGNATTATVDQCAPSWVTSDGNQPSLRLQPSRQGSAQSFKGATCCWCSGWTGLHQDLHLAFSG